MQSLLSPVRDDLAIHLPPLLRWLPIKAVLLPPSRVTGAARLLYPIRMTMAVVALILFAVHVALFAWLGQGAFACLAALGLVVALGLSFLMRRGVMRLAIALGWVVVFGYVVALDVTFGRSSGALLFAFPIALAGFLIHTSREWVARLVPITFALACCTALVGHFELPPRVVLPAGESHLLLGAQASGALYAVMVLASHAIVFREAAELIIAAERDRADRLLCNILPESIAARLMDQPGTIADSFDEVSVVFADLVGFTALASQLSGTELVELLNRLFSEFDSLAERHGLEKIKTIGDAYMVVGGLPAPLADSVERAARMALDMKRAVEREAAESGRALALRIGVHVGPVTAGVIGKNKFSYDLWGDTVNVASRMESSGEPGRIQVSGAVYQRLGRRFVFGDRRELSIKGKGTMEAWLLIDEQP
jgi:class 3 adenylate cyclase